MATCAAIKAAGAQRFVIDINYWLDRVPEGTDSAGAQKRKRAPLEEMSENIASGSAPSTPQAKRARQNAGGPPPVEDDTPRAQNLQLFESNIALRPGSAAAPVQEPEKSSTATTSTSTSSYLDDSQSGASKKRKRSVSPIKSMSALRLLRHTVRNQPIDVVEDLPETFQELALKMEKIKCGEGIIYPERQGELFPLLGARYRRPEAVDPDRLRIGQIPSLAVLEKIKARAKTCNTRNHAEPTWNCDVHARLLDEAQSCSPYRESINQWNITTASIQPETLVPDASATMKVNSKKADFAIVLELPETVERALFGADIESVTQTMYEPLRYSPIAINIETKKDVKMDEALRSLSIWTSAQITKTRDLLVKAGRPDVSIPPLPILVVQGHQWYFAVMEDKIADGNEGYTNCWNKILFGSTESLTDILQVVAGLQCLIHWAATVYKPWFEANILEPLGVMPTSASHLHS